jgi:hypothetical protein
MECHGEARGDDGTPLFPDGLLIEVRVDAWGLAAKVARGFGLEERPPKTAPPRAVTR